LVLIGFLNSPNKFNQTSLQDKFVIKDPPYAYGMMEILTGYMWNPIKDSLKKQNQSGVNPCLKPVTLGHFGIGEQ
jgi:hypothetical protein